MHGFWFWCNGGNILTIWSMNYFMSSHELEQTDGVVMIQPIFFYLFSGTFET